MTGFWHKPKLPAKSRQAEELERRWADEDRERDARMGRLLVELSRHSDLMAAWTARTVQEPSHGR